MPRSLDNHLSYSGGELSPLMDARVDHPKYASGCRQLQNMIALRSGGCTRRPGTIFKALAKYQDTDTRQYAARLMEFQFSPTTSFILEFGHQYIRFYSNQQQVLVTGAPLWVNGNLYVPGNFVRDPSDSNNTYYCIQLNAGIQPPPSTNPLYWVKQNIYEVPTNFNGRVTLSDSIYDCDVWRIVPCQINDIVYLVHPDYPPHKLERLGNTNWVLSVVNFLTPALLDQNATGIQLTPTATTGNISLAASAPAWGTATYYDVGRSVSNSGMLYTCIYAHVSGTFATDLANGYWRLETIFTSGNVEGVFQVGYVRDSASITQDLTADGTSGTIEASGECSLDTYGTWSATLDLERSDDGGTTWYKVRTVVSLNDHNTSLPIKVQGTALFRLVVSNYTASTGTPRATFTIVSSVANGLVRITGVADAYNATGVVLQKLYDTAASIIWSEGAWSERRGYPQAVTIFQQRAVYGGSEYEPQRIWCSQTDDLENFDRGDQTLATDGLAFTVAAVRRGRIQWLIGQVDLFVGFSGAEWIVNAGEGSFGGSNQPITPTQINAGEHSAWGSASGIPPRLVGNAVLYPQRAARTMQQMVFSVYTNKYQSADLTTLSEHLFGDGIAQIAHQPQFRTQSIVWCITKSYALVGMTYDMQESIYAWHRHISGYDAANNTVHAFESVACIDGQGDQDDEVWVVVDRPGGRCIELMNPNNWETAGGRSKGIPQPYLAQAIFVDSALSVDAPVSNVISGLNHLVGLNVIGLLNGKFTFGPLEVQPDGTVTIDGWEPEITDIVQVGLPIEYAVQGMRMDVDGRAGIVMGVMKALSKVFVRVYNSLSGKIKGNGLKEIPLTYKIQTTPPGEVGPLTTGQREVVPEFTQTEDPIMIVTGSDPLPLTLLATTVRISITGSA